MDFGSGGAGDFNDCFKGLPPAFQTGHVFFYTFDSYDISPGIDTSGDWLQSRLVPAKKMYQPVYFRDWTGSLADQLMTKDARQQDPPNQLKYRNPPLDRTVLSWCNSHVTTAKADRCPVIFASGTAKTITFKHMAESGWNISYAPYAN